MEAIKTAWRKLAREHHPDVSSGDGAQERRSARLMAEINDAYRELRDPERRARHREAAVRMRGSGPARAGGEAGEWPMPPRRTRVPEPRHVRPVTARIDTSSLLRPRNTVLEEHGSALRGWPPRPRRMEDRQPLRASTPTGPTHRRPGPNLDSEMPSFEAAIGHRLNFGKFAGLTLGEVGLVEPSYVDWIARTIDRDAELRLAARVVLRYLERSGVIRRQRLDSPFSH